MSVLVFYHVTYRNGDTMSLPFANTEGHFKRAYERVIRYGARGRGGVVAMIREQ